MKKLIGKGLQLDWKIAVLTVVSTLLLLVDLYGHRMVRLGVPEWGISARSLDRLILYFLIPMLVILVVFREHPREYGFTFGDWRAGLLLTALGILLITPVLWFVGHLDSSMQDYYAHMRSGLPLSTFVDLLGWEFMFRGWLLFGYARRFGAEALWLQAVPFALAHVGKPEVETLSTIFGGFAFGWVAWRTKSFIYPFLIHWYVASFTILVSAGVLG